MTEAKPMTADELQAERKFFAHYPADCFGRRVLATIDDLTARAEAAEARIKRLEEVLQGAISEYDRNVCHHETLVRGGAIWTICQDCGAKWADDEGGFVPYQDPPKISIARAALTTGGSHADEA